MTNDLWPDIPFERDEDDEAVRLISLFREQAAFGNAHFYNRGLMFYASPVQQENHKVGYGLFVEIRSRTYFEKCIAKVSFDPAFPCTIWWESDFGDQRSDTVPSASIVVRLLTGVFHDRRLWRLLANLSEIAQPRTDSDT